MQRLLVRPASRAIRVQRSTISSNSVARSLATTACRKFGVTSAVNKRNIKNVPPPDAEFFGETGENVADSAPKVSEASSSKSSTSTTPKSAAPTPKATVFASPASPTPRSSPGPPHDAAVGLSSVHGFNPTKYFKSWSVEAIQPALSAHAIDLLQYLTRLVETEASLNALSALDHHQSLDFKKRWLAYELDQENAQAHLPLLEFFLYRGLQLLPPTIGSIPVAQRIVSVDPAAVQRALGNANGPWQTTSSVLEKHKPAVIPFPNLMTPDALLDPRDVLELPPSRESPFHNRIVVRNHRSVFHNYVEGAEDDLLQEDELEENENQDQDDMMRSLPVSSKYYGDLHQSILMRRSVVQQTGKGKIRRVAFMVLVGDGNGLVGYGEGKHSNGATALKAARLAAVKNMDWVERFEKRTIWTEMSTKLGATQVILRPRPVGFGLRCNPHLHRILRAAGLKDISAKIWGSRNKLNVIKAAFRLLHAGHAPTAMGDGVGGKGKKLSKGGGLKSKDDLERARGRKLINLRK